MRESSNEKWSWPLVYFHLMIFLTILLESRRWKQKSLSHVRLFATPWTMQSMEFSRPEYCVGSLSLLQGTFPTQESNQGLLHCRQILYQLSYQDRPITSLLPLDDEAGQHFFFFADLGLPCCVRTFSSCHVQTPHCGGFCCCRAWAQGGRASVIAAHQPRSCDRQV